MAPGEGPERGEEIVPAASGGHTRARERDEGEEGGGSKHVDSARFPLRSVKRAARWDVSALDRRGF